MAKRLEGKSVIVTGAGRYSGEGIAKTLASEGAGVLVVDRDEVGAQRVAYELREAGAHADHAVTDVSSTVAVAAMARQALELFGRIDILCPNAAIFDRSPIAEMPEALWDKLLSVNLKGVFLCVQACLPAMTAQRYGRIVVTSSITGPRTAIAGMAHYAASKGGINGFIRAAALDLADARNHHQRDRAWPCDDRRRGAHV